MHQARELQHFRSRLALLLGAILLLSFDQTSYSFAQSSVSGSSNRSEEEVLAAERAILEGFSSGALGAAPDTDLSPRSVAGREMQPLKLKQAAQSGTSAGNRIVVRKEVMDPDINQSQPGLSSVSEDASRSGPGTSTKISAPSASRTDLAEGGSTALKRELEASQRRVFELERQLEDVRGQLTMAETELSRMATISEARNRASLGRLAEVPADTTKRSQADAPSVKVAERGASIPEPLPSSNDLMIVTVAVEKAELRLGPGKNHSALMSVSRGSRLAVEARQGEWYRVFAPNGQRAWVLSRVVTVGDRSSSEQRTSALRVKGYSSSLEDEAFRRVQAVTAGH